MTRHKFLPLLLLLILLMPLTATAQEKMSVSDSRHMTVSKHFNAWKTDSLELRGSKLWFADSVLLGSRSLSVTALDEKEMPKMNYGMVNVTGGGEGYRYLPHGTHFTGEGATVSLRYDRSRIPAGYSEQDIYTFYYDERNGKWIALERIGIDRESQSIVSRTTHFTDMINGIIQTPSMPETGGFAPTMMNDLPTANPAAGMNIIAPPMANSRGTAALSYPIEMPPARNSMSPDLSICYDSESGSGWLGEGWDLPVPSITVDTRWGVPRYDTSMETETYLLNGAMLSMTNGQQLTVAHRDTTMQRITDRQFYSRQGGDFSRIIRKGSSPTGYYWVVTDRNGVKYTFGGSENSRLFDSTRGIAEWRLSRIEETHGDHVEYEYEKRDEDVAGSVTAKAIYLKKIKVCHAGIGETIITVTFTSGQQKAIRTNSGRYGFLTSCNALLTGIDVKFRGSPLRAYAFTYGSGRFGKDLLTAVTHRALNESGSLTDFATQTFSYYEADAGNNIFNSDTETLSVTDDHLGSSFSISTLIQDGKNSPTAIGGTGTTSVSTSVYTGIGPYIPLPFKTGTAGMSAGVSLDKSNGMSTLVDINGDGIPDKVFRKSGHVYTRLATATANGIAYGQDILLTGLDGFLTTTSLSTSFGGKGTLGSGALIAMRGIDQTKTRVTTSEYLMDINGDGLVDYVKDEKVYFNHLDGNGIPTFTLNSGDTPNPLGHTGSVDTSLADDDTTDEQEMADASPMMDVVRFWEAPRDGLVSLSGTITQLQVADDNYDEADGVRAAVQLGSSEIWSQVIPKGGSASYSLTDRTVAKGQRIYFRLQAGSQAASNGYGDLVRWIPYVEYTDIDCYQDTPDGFDDKSFDIGNGLIYSNDDCVRVPDHRKIVVTGTVSKPSVSDDILMKLIGYSDSNPQTPHVLDSAKVLSDDWQVTKTMTIPNNQNYRNIHVELSAKSNINWVDPDFSFTISVYAASSTSVIDTTLTCPYKITPLTRMIHAGEEFPIGNRSTIRIRPNATIITPGFPNTPLDTVYLSVKTADRLVFQKAYTTTTLQSVQYVTVAIDGYDASDVWFEYSYPGKWTNTTPSQPYVSVYDSQTGYTQNVKAAFFTMRDDERFGPMYRGWGGFLYNAGNGRYAQPIDESLLTLPTDSASANPTTIVLLPMYADMSHPNDPLMRGMSDRLYYNYYEARTGRMGLQDVNFGSSALLRSSSSGDGIAVTQKSVNTGSVEQGGISFGTYSNASGENVVKSAMMDMNGDGYPDLVTNHGIQYSTVLGGLGGRRYLSDGMERTYNSSYAVGVGGSPVPSFSGIDIIQGARDAGHTGFAKALSVLKDISLQGNDNYNEDTTVCGFFDINGDGLPDRFSKTTGGSMEVALNVGNGFAAPYPWTYGDVRVNKSMAASVGGSGNIDIAATSMAAGITYVTSGSRDIAALADVNGDGLPDLLKETGNALQVQLNTGNGFGPVVQISGLSSIGNTQSTSESVNVAFTANIPLPTLSASMLSVSPSGSVGQSVSRPLSALTDIDGDGYTDVVSSDNAGTMQVCYSTLGRTNRLKTVTNALGGTFTIDYEHTDASYDLPGGRWVMSALEVDDGIDDDGPVMRSRFDYGGGRYDRREREFLGFATVSTIELDTENADAEYRRTVETYDNQSYYHQGALTSTAVKDATGSTLSEKTTEYYTYGVAPSGNAYTLTETNTVNDHGAYFIAPKYTEDRLEGTVMTQSLNQYKTTASHGEISDYYYSDKGTMNASTGSGCDYHTFIGYTDKTASHVFGLPSSVTVYGNSGTYHYTTAQYNGTYPTDLTSVTRKLNTSSYATTLFQYDTHGNITRKTMPDNNLYYNYTYDTAVGMYATGISDAFGLSCSAVYDYRYGVATQVTDANGAYTNTIIDNIGRLKSIRLPNDNQNSQSMEISYTPMIGSTPARATTTYNLRQTVSGNSLGTATDTRQVVTFADGFGRVIQTREELSLNGSSSVSVVANGRNDYDAFGRIVKSYYPAAVNGLSSFTHAQASEKGITTEYDPLDRLLSETYPDGNSMERSYSAANHLLETTVTDPNGHTRKTRTDGNGKTVSTVRYDDNNTAITTSFTYDGIGRLTDVCDAGGNHTLSEYDMGDRRTSVTHPATGTTTFTYDVMGNMTGKTTAANEHITYTYDCGRLINITYPNHPANNVAYYYGDNSEQDGRKGRLAFREDASGGIEYEYDNMGNVKATLRTLIIPGHGQATFRTQWVYDNFGKLLRITYPDNDVVTYRYNGCGDLTKIFKGVYENNSPRTYVSSVNYDVFGRRTAVNYGNGTQNTYSFDTGRQWLTGISVAKAGTTLMNRGYEYDDVGNVTGISDIDNLSHDYEYDALDRLVAADGSYGLSSAADHTTYHTETAYDNLWRITSGLYEKTWPNNTSRPYYGYGLSYNYRNDRKYHLNTVVKQNYTNAAHSTSGSGLTYPYYYDAKGNMTDEDNVDWYCWDEENRLTGVYHDDYSLSSYIYDADGMRTYRNSEYSIKLLVNSQQQYNSSVMYYNLYPSEYYVIHNGNSYTKHVYMDGERIATLLGSDNSLLDDYSNSSITLAGTPFITGNVSQHYAAKRTAKESDLINSLEEVFGSTYSVTDLQGSVTYGGAQVTDLPYYFHRDHLGSTALVTDSVGNIDHRIEYTPDGSLFFQTVTGNYRTPYRFNAKEFDDDTELYYFGARYYDKNLGIWISPDPMAEDYPGVSSYAYCAGNPVNLIDKKGEKIVFVNGKIGGGSPPAGINYWGGTNLYNSTFINGAKSYYSDDNVFVMTNDYNYFSSAKERYNSGYLYAKSNIDILTSDISVEEDFKFVTHSMGAAFAEGMATFLIENGYRVSELVHINSFQAADISTVGENSINTFTIDYQNTNDLVINFIPFYSSPGSIKGADLKIRVKSNEPLIYVHSSPIWDTLFWEKMKQLAPRKDKKLIDSPIRINNINNLKM